MCHNQGRGRGWTRPVKGRGGPEGISLERLGDSRWSHEGSAGSGGASSNFGGQRGFQLPQSTQQVPAAGSAAISPAGLSDHEGWAKQQAATHSQQAFTQGYGQVTSDVRWVVTRRVRKS